MPVVNDSVAVTLHAHAFQPLKGREKLVGKAIADGFFIRTTQQISFGEGWMRFKIYVLVANYCTTNLVEQVFRSNEEGRKLQVFGFEQNESL